eukprot:177278_1
MCEDQNEISLQLLDPKGKTNEPNTFETNTYGTTVVRNKSTDTISCRTAYVLTIIPFVIWSLLFNVTFIYVQWSIFITFAVCIALCCFESECCQAIFWCCMGMGIMFSVFVFAIYFMFSGTWFFILISYAWLFQISFCILISIDFHLYFIKKDGNGLFGVDGGNAEKNAIICLCVPVLPVAVGSTFDYIYNYLTFEKGYVYDENGDKFCVENCDDYGYDSIILIVYYVYFSLLMVATLIFYSLNRKYLFSSKLKRRFALCVMVMFMVLFVGMICRFIYYVYPHHLQKDGLFWAVYNPPVMPFNLATIIALNKVRKS